MRYQDKGSRADARLQGGLWLKVDIAIRLKSYNGKLKKSHVVKC